MVAKDKGLTLTLYGEVLYTKSEYRRTRAEALALGMMLGILGSVVVALVVAIVFDAL